MTDSDPLVEIKALLRRHAVSPGLTRECLAAGTAADWLVTEVERLRALLEPTVIVSPPPAPDPENANDPASPQG